MTLSIALLLTALILLVAVLYSSVGHAGASGYLAAMALLGVSAEVMKPTALTLNVLVAVIATVQFARAGHLQTRLLWPLAAASIPAAFVGGAIDLPGVYYRPMIGVILLYSAWRLWGRREHSPVQSETRSEGASGAAPGMATLLVLGGVLGLLAGISGTGGGIFLSPLLILTRWATAKQTAAVSSAFILLNSIAGIVGYASRAGGVPGDLLHWGWLWAIAAALGGTVGSHAGARRLASPTIQRLLTGVLVIAALKLIAG